MELIPIIYIILEVTLILTILTIVISKIANRKEPEKKLITQQKINENGKESLNNIKDNKINSATFQNINNYSLSNSKHNLQQKRENIVDKNKRIEILNNNNHGKIQSFKHNHGNGKKVFDENNEYDLLSKYTDDENNLYNPVTKKKNNKNEI